MNTREVGIIVIHLARPDFVVADRSKFADTDLKAAAKGMYLIRDFSADREPAGTVFVQGSSSSFNLVQVIPRLEEARLNVRIVAVISEELFRLPIGGLSAKHRAGFGAIRFHLRYDDDEAHIAGLRTWDRWLRSMR